MFLILFHISQKCTFDEIEITSAVRLTTDTERS